MLRDGRHISETPSIHRRKQSAELPSLQRWANVENIFGTCYISFLIRRQLISFPNTSIMFRPWIWGKTRQLWKVIQDQTQTFSLFFKNLFIFKLFFFFLQLIHTRNPKQKKKFLPVLAINQGKSNVKFPPKTAGKFKKTWNLKGEGIILTQRLNPNSSGFSLSL